MSETSSKREIELSKRTGEKEVAGGGGVGAKVRRLDSSSSSSSIERRAASSSSAAANRDSAYSRNSEAEYVERSMNFSSSEHATDDEDERGDGSQSVVAGRNTFEGVVVDEVVLRRKVGTVQQQQQSTLERHARVDSDASTPSNSAPNSRTSSNASDYNRFRYDLECFHNKNWYFCNLHVVKKYI